MSASNTSSNDEISAKHALAAIIPSLGGLSSKVNANTSLYTNLEKLKAFVDSGTSEFYITATQPLSNTTPQRLKLKTEARAPIYTTQMGKLQLTRGSLPIYLTAKQVSEFQKNLIGWAMSSETKCDIHKKPRLHLASQ